MESPKKSLTVQESLLLNLLTHMLSFVHGKPIMLIRPSVRIHPPTKVTTGEEFAVRFTTDGTYVNVIMSGYFISAPGAFQSYDLPETVIATVMLRLVGGGRLYDRPARMTISTPDNTTPQKQWDFWFDGMDTIPVVQEILNAVFQAHNKVSEEK